MTYREIAMWEILEVLRRVGRGENKSEVARTTGQSRKTVRGYVRTAVGLGWVRGEEEPSEELAAQVYARHRPASDRSPGEAEARLLGHRDQIKEWLKPGPTKKRGLQLTKVHKLLRRRGVDVPYSTLHRFAVKHCGFSDRRRITVRRADCDPGELAEVDFGKLGLIPDPDTGRRRTAWALIVTLGYSRHQYVHVTFTQKIPDVIEGLEDAWRFFGGCVRRVVVDNMKSAVTKADRYDPIFARTFEDYARYRGFVIDAAPPSMPTGKPVVERAVPYVRENFFRGETWLNLEHVGREAVRWCRETAGTRIHGTTRKRPLAVFENVEREQLLPLTRERYDPPTWAPCKVHPDHHINFGKDPVLGTDALSPTTGLGLWKLKPGAHLRRRPPHQDPSQAGAWRSLHGLRRLSGRAHALRAAGSPAHHPTGQVPQLRYRPLHGAAPVRHAALDQDPAGPEAPASQQ